VNPCAHELYQSQILKFSTCPQNSILSLLLGTVCVHCIRQERWLPQGRGRFGGQNCTQFRDAAYCQITLAIVIITAVLYTPPLADNCTGFCAPTVVSFYCIILLKNTLHKQGSNRINKELSYDILTSNFLRMFHNANCQNLFMHVTVTATVTVNHFQTER